jgi:hypothetical protein
MDGEGMSSYMRYKLQGFGLDLTSQRSPKLVIFFFRCNPVTGF